MTSRPYRPVGTIPTNAHYEKTSFQRFLSDPPRSFFKKLIVSTPRLLRNLHTMSLAKATPDGLKDRECEKMVLRERPPIPYVPEMKVRGHEFLQGTLVRARLFSLS